MKEWTNNGNNRVLSLHTALISCQGVVPVDAVNEVIITVLFAVYTIKRHIYLFMYKNIYPNYCIPSVSTFVSGKRRRNCCIWRVVLTIAGCNFKDERDRSSIRCYIRSIGGWCFNCDNFYTHISVWGICWPFLWGSIKMPPTLAWCNWDRVRYIAG